MTIFTTKSLVVGQPVTLKGSMSLNVYQKSSIWSFFVPNLTGLCKFSQTSEHNIYCYFWSYTKTFIPRSVYYPRAVVCTHFWGHTARLGSSYGCVNIHHNIDTTMLHTYLLQIVGVVQPHIWEPQHGWTNSKTSANDSSRVVGSSSTKKNSKTPKMKKVIVFWSLNVMVDILHNPVRFGTKIAYAGTHSVTSSLKYPSTQDRT